MKLALVSPVSQPFTFLKSLGFDPVLVSPPPIDEVLTQEPAVFGSEIASRYQLAAQNQYKKALTLSLVSFLVYRNRRLLPPKFKMEALPTLEMLSGHTFSLYTYWSVKRPNYKDPQTGLTETKITLKNLTHNFLTSYVNDHEVTKSPLILDFTDPHSFTLITRLDGSLNNFLYYLPIENIDLSNL